MYMKRPDPWALEWLITRNALKRRNDQCYDYERLALSGRCRYSFPYVLFALFFLASAMTLV